MVTLHVFVLTPPLEQPPDQMASRPLLTLSVTTVPVAKLALPVVPTLTLSPAGLEETVSPVRPVAVSVNKAPAGCGLTVRVAVRMAPPPEPVIVTAVELTTALVVTAKVALVAPAPMVTLAGTVATAVFALLRPTTAPPAGAPAVSVTVPCDELPPTTEVGVTLTEDKLATGGGAAVVTVKLPGSSTPPAPNPPLVAVPLGVVTVTPPVAAPAGTVAVTCAFPVTLNSAGRPPEPNVTWLAPPR